MVLLSCAKQDQITISESIKDCAWLWMDKGRLLGLVVPCNGCMEACPIHESILPT